MSSAEIFYPVYFINIFIIYLFYFLKKIRLETKGK